MILPVITEEPFDGGTKITVSDDGIEHVTVWFRNTDDSTEHWKKSKLIGEAVASIVCDNLEVKVP